MKTCLWPFLWLLVAGSPAGWGEGLFHPKSRDRVAQVDIDGSGDLSRIEVLLGLHNKEIEGYLNLPAMRAEGKIPQALQEDLEKRVAEPPTAAGRNKLAARYAGFTKRHGAQGPWSLDQVDPDEFAIKNVDKMGPTKQQLASQAQLGKWDFKVRRTREDLSKPIDDPFGQGALFSFGHNYNTKTDTWIMRGVAQFSYALGDNPAFDPLSVDKNAPRGAAAVNQALIWNDFNLNFVTSWDKVQVSPGAAGEVDSLRFDLDVSRTATLTEKTFVGHLMDGFKVRAGGFWITDFDFAQEIFGGELEIFPQFLLPGCQKTARIGKYRRFDKDAAIIAARWTPWAHVEGGSVQEAGPSDQLGSNDSFVRVGGGAMLEVWVLPDALDNRFTLQAKYLYYEGLLAGVEATHLFTATAQYILPIGSGLYQPVAAKGVDDAPFVNRERDLLVAFKVEYTDGEQPVTQQRDHFLLFGIGIAF